MSEAEDAEPAPPPRGQPHAAPRDQPPAAVPAALPPFESLIEAHGATVLRVCRALVGPTDADDVWQETFLAALRVYPATAPVMNRQAWLVRIARNKSVDQYRRAARVPEPTEGLSDGALGEGTLGDGALGRNVLGGGDAVVRSLEARETADTVWGALARLPQKQREAVVYHHIAGLKYADAAVLLGNSEAAARRAASDGMKALRILFTQKEEDRT